MNNPRVQWEFVIDLVIFNLELRASSRVIATSGRAIMYRLCMVKRSATAFTIVISEFY